MDDSRWDWQQVTLREVTDRIDYGYTASASADPVGPRFLRITDIVGSGLDWGSVPYCRIDPSERTRYSLADGDLVIARTGATVGSTAYIRNPPDAVFASYLVRAKVSASHDAQFIYYATRTEAWRHFIDSIASGKSAQPNASASAMAEFTLDVPHVREQRAIAGVLGALDDKIESNRRLLQTSLSICASVFEEQRIQRTESDSVTFAEFCDIYGGATPSTSVDAYWNGPHAWATPSDITALSSPHLFDTDRHITDEGLSSSSTTLHPVGSILMTSRATIGAFAVNQVPCATNQGFIVVRPRREEHRWFLFHEMQRRVDEMIDRSSGTTFRELSRGSFKAMSLDVPTYDHEFARLHAEVDPLHARAAAAAHESQALATLRDALLPELLSGRLRVREAEKVVEGPV